MTLTRATLGNLTKRQTKPVTIGEYDVVLQRPTPLQFSRFQSSIIDPKTREFDVTRFPAALELLVAQMWIDEDGKRLFSDHESSKITDGEEAVDIEFYQRLSEECQLYSSVKRGETETLGESEETTD